MRNPNREIYQDLGRIFEILPHVRTRKEMDRIYSIVEDIESELARLKHEIGIKDDEIRQHMVLYTSQENWWEIKSKPNQPTSTTLTSEENDEGQ